MRQFVVVGRDAPTTPDFSLDSLPGAGRMDLLARSVTASLLLSHGIRENVRIHLVLDDEFTIQFEGSTIRGLYPDERSTAALVRNALAERKEAIGHIPVEVSPGVSLVRMGLDATLDNLAEDVTVYRLHGEGVPKVEIQTPVDPVFVLSNHTKLDGTDEEVVSQYAERRISLGPHALHADHAITVTHNWLDTATG